MYVSKTQVGLVYCQNYIFEINYNSRVVFTITQYLKFKNPEANNQPLPVIVPIISKLTKIDHSIVTQSMHAWYLAWYIANGDQNL